MIIDSIKNKDLYLSVNPGFKAAFEFIEKCIAENLPEGKYQLEGEDFANVQSYETNDNIGRFEAHRKYIDIQFIISGEEYMECTPLSYGKVSQEYNAEKDVEFFSAPAKTRFTLSSGEYVIFFPEDIHNPGLSPETKQNIKKIVVKIKTA